MSVSHGSLIVILKIVSHEYLPESDLVIVKKKIQSLRLI